MSTPHGGAASVTVRLWHAASSSDQPGQLEHRCEGWLIDDEHERADRFRVPTSRNQHVVGRGMARRLLGGDDVPPRSIRFSIESHGKPFVTHPESASQPFNVAHTDGLVLCGIGPKSSMMVGVDVERVGRRTDPELAERYFSRPEVDYLRALSDPKDRRDAFLRIWTLKESFIKAIGTGLQTPLADFAFEDIESDSPRIRLLNPDLEGGHRWRFFSIEPRPGFIAAVAAGVPDKEVDVALDVNPFDDFVAESR